MFYFNLFVSVVALWGIMFVYNNYIRIAHRNNDRFKLFALRDELCFLVMEGKLDVDAPEFRILRRLINDSIRVLSNKFSIVGFVRFLYRSYTGDSTMHKEIEHIINSLNHKNQDYKRILYDYWATIQHIVKKRTWLLTYVLFGILNFLVKLHIMQRGFVYKKVETLKRVDNQMNDYLQMCSSV
ncbi:MAG: hypothetical protein HQL06_11290 [Nitrospirae bacterium]|nr:hypothetical protein [Nitrospirota bacterium]